MIMFEWLPAKKSLCIFTKASKAILMLHEYQRHRLTAEFPEAVLKTQPFGFRNPVDPHQTPFWLSQKILTYLEVALGGKGLGADAAFERLVPRVRSHVDLQRARARERLLANLTHVPETHPARQRRRLAGRRPDRMSIAARWRPGRRWSA